MPFDESIFRGREGVGRTPAANPIIKTYDTGIVNEDISIGSDETFTLPIGSGERVLGVFVSLQRNTAGGIPFGNAINCKFQVFINETPVAVYALPQDNDWVSSIAEIVPINMELWGTGNELKIVMGAASGTSYNIFRRVMAYTIPL